MLFSLFVMMLGAVGWIILPAALDVRPTTIPRHFFRDFGYFSLRESLLFGISEPLVFVFLFAGVTPSLSGVLVAWLAYGRAGLRQLAHRFKFWQQPHKPRAALATYFLTVFAALVATAIMVVLHFVWAEANDQIATRPWAAATVSSVMLAILTGMFGNPGGVLEEATGFRGFALPSLLEQGVSPLKASLLTGLIQFGWHLYVPFSPFLVDPHVFSQTTFWSVNLPVLYALFFIGTMGLAVVSTFVYLRTGSVWICIWAHGFVNTIPFSLAVSYAGRQFASQQSLNYTLVFTSLLAVSACLVLATGGLRTRERVGGRATAALGTSP